MNKSLVVRLGALCFLLVGFAILSQASLNPSKPKIAECMKNLERRIATVGVPDTLRLMVHDLWKAYRELNYKRPALTWMANNENFRLMIAKYLPKLKGGYLAALVGDADIFLRQSIDFKYEIECSDEDFFELIDVKNDEYKEIFQKNKKVDRYFGYVELARTILDAHQGYIKVV